MIELTKFVFLVLWTELKVILIFRVVFQYS